MALLLVTAPSAAAVSQLSWAPPTLTDPIVLHPSGPVDLVLDSSRDYVVDLGSAPLRGAGGLVLEGGHNVVIKGGEIDVPAQQAPAGQQFPSPESRRGLYLKNQTGTVHVEGVHITGDGLTEGIDLHQQYGAIVQIENVRVEAIHAADEVGFTDNHPDVVQTWAGPAELRIDGLTGTTDFQGLMLNPTDIGPYPARAITLRRINFHSLATADKLFNKVGSDPMTFSDLWYTDPGNKWYCHVWPCAATWDGVQEGMPPGGDYVPVGEAGTGYRSPGYAAPSIPGQPGSPSTPGQPTSPSGQPGSPSTPAPPSSPSVPGSGGAATPARPAMPALGSTRRRSRVARRSARCVRPRSGSRRARRRCRATAQRRRASRRLATRRRGAHRRHGRRIAGPRRVAVRRGQLRGSSHRGGA